MTDESKEVVASGGRVPLWPLFALIFLAVVVVVGTILLRSGRFSGLESFPVASYREQPLNLMGNRYVLDAQINSQLLWDEDVGRLIAVSPEGEKERLAVFVASGTGANLQVGQRYRMRVVVRDQGLIIIEDLEKY